jgi:hypothetical protein
MYLKKFNFFLKLISKITNQVINYISNLKFLYKNISKTRNTKKFELQFLKILAYGRIQSILEK